MITLKQIMNKDFQLELFAIQHSFPDNFKIKVVLHRFNPICIKIRFVPRSWDKKKTAHCLRVTCASRLFQSGVDEKLTRDRTGHVSNALFKCDKASADQAKHVSNILSADRVVMGTLKKKLRTNVQ